MAAIAGIGVHLPEQVPIDELQRQLGLSDQDTRRFKRAFGYEAACFDPAKSEADLLVEAALDLPDFEAVRHRIRWVIRARTIRIAAPWPAQPLTDACRRLGLTHARCFTVTDQACASGMLAVRLGARLLRDSNDPEALVLVLAGEKTYGECSRVIPNIALLSEGAAAALVTAVEGPDEILGVAVQQAPVVGGSLHLDEEGAARFSSIYGEKLNGTIEEVLATVGITVAELDAYLPHNVSRIASLRAARSLGLPTERVLTGTVARTAHCWSADPFLNLRKATESGELQPGDRYLLTSVGLGATFGAMVCRH